MQKVTNTPPKGVSESLAIRQLDQIFAHASFSASPRCRDFLNFVVRETLTGRGDTIKERTIAMEVFGKDSSFEPGEDSLVRVKAREVRKRLAEFYEQHPASQVRIDLPLGGYVPTFQEAAEELSPPPVVVVAEPPAKPSPLISRRTLLWGGGAVAASAVAWPILRYVQGPSTLLERLWAPIFSTRAPLLISIPLLPSGDGSTSERVGLGAATAANETTEFLGSHRYPYRVRFGSDLTFSQLREQPSLLLGGFSSTWTTRTTESLRYTLVPTPGVNGGSIHDAQTGTIYGPISNESVGTEDYALICRLFNAPSGQITLVAAGITTYGTESAARFFLRPELFSQIVAGQGKDWAKSSFQAVIKLSIFDRTPSAPTLIATHFWR